MLAGPYKRSTISEAKWSALPTILFTSSLQRMRTQFISQACSVGWIPTPWYYSKILFWRIIVVNWDSFPLYLNGHSCKKTGVSLCFFQDTTCNGGFPILDQLWSDRWSVPCAERWCGPKSRWKRVKDDSIWWHGNLIHMHLEADSDICLRWEVKGGYENAEHRSRRSIGGKQANMPRIQHWYIAVIWSSWMSSYRGWFLINASQPSCQFSYCL